MITGGLVVEKQNINSFNDVDYETVRRKPKHEKEKTKHSFKLDTNAKFCLFACINKGSLRSIFPLFHLPWPSSRSSVVMYGGLSTVIAKPNGYGGEGFALWFEGGRESWKEASSKVHELLIQSHEKGEEEEHDITMAATNS
ncbi:uncharacterized protein HKW66_Vig0222290 [Vigna angularis]|uniref:Uncharacterized protein n=1 Tax=Phaseolus angularis TaxID=3914 RepID=A0A8T0K3S8_PHAAN|nr:uncharacterized protein HKW66_Vig0222290 [Vigna angularis]